MKSKVYELVIKINEIRTILDDIRTGNVPIDQNRDEIDMYLEEYMDLLESIEVTY